ncbi:hypothetical protein METBISCDRAFT_23283 [Metschnikowia bicuspidata]|uniref:DUF2423 domain-containing protein n=1 Tax=Metschnikowia bicuspidata TaxID=27322 RepID=A0A4P9ZC67_9ASCO|nr:hypothetical protein METBISCDRAFT_23283 [Metschnikowia bicuspidata]
MAKSLRSKPKLRAKSIKRNNEFAKFVDERDQRLFAKIQANLERQKAQAEAEAKATANEASNAVETAETAETDASAMGEDKPQEPAVEPKQHMPKNSKKEKKYRVRAGRNRKVGRQGRSRSLVF